MTGRLSPQERPAVDPSPVGPARPPSLVPSITRDGQTPDPAAPQDVRGVSGARRVRAESPAIGAGANPAPLAGSRSFTIALPAGLLLLSLNDRFGWRERHARGQVIKNAACVVARQAKVPRLARARIAVVYEPPDRRHRDADNPVASAKNAVDGIVMAGVLIDDECPRYVAGIWCTIGEIHPKGRLVVHLTELAALTGGVT